MRALVIYESMFGNTRVVAEAIGLGLAERMPTEVLEVGEAPVELPDDVTLVVVGGPTHALGMSRVNTREDAARRAEHPVVSATIGQREWLQRVQLPARVSVATFDTRMGTAWWTGSAARRADRRLASLGARRLFEPVSFLVRATAGPLADGESHRAYKWGENLADRHVAEWALA
jgi:flavorubredoxin